MKNKIKKIHCLYKEQISYLFFGVCTTLINWITYAILVAYIDINISNIISWIFAVIFAFITNKLWVFKSIDIKGILLFKELLAFFISRIFTGIFEIGAFSLLIYLGMDYKLFGIEGFASKLFISIFVVILNYILSKKIVFKNKNSKNL